MRRAGGGPKPWGPILKAMLHGDLCFGLKAGRRLAECTLIPASEADRVRAATFDRADHPDMLFQRMIQGDAIEVLENTPSLRKLTEKSGFAGFERTLVPQRGGCAGWGANGQIRKIPQVYPR